MIRLWRLIAPALALLAGRAQAQLTLDQLSACDDMAQALALLRSNQRECRAPRTAIEQGLTQRIATWRVPVCWLVRAPARSLSRFACLIVHLPTGPRYLDCMAESDPARVVAYRQTYEPDGARYSTVYLAAASRCSFSNGRAAPAGPSFMSIVVAMIVQLDVGFALQVGREVVGTSTILHGYGRLDPEIVGHPNAGVEFVSMWIPA